jgi:hypothetical protein
MIDFPFNLNHHRDLTEIFKSRGNLTELNEMDK